MSRNHESPRFINLSGSAYNFANTGQIAGNIIGSSYNVRGRQTIVEAALEIQQLLKQLELINPNATDFEKVVYVNDETTPSFKRRVIGALKANGETAIDEFLDSPHVHISKAIIKGWMQPE